RKRSRRRRALAIHGLLRLRVGGGAPSLRPLRHAAGDDPRLRRPLRRRRRTGAFRVPTNLSVTRRGASPPFRRSSRAWRRGPTRLPPPDRIARAKPALGTRVIY